VLISEAFLLLVTTDEGKWLAGSQAVPIALAGGLLAELAAADRISIDERGRLAAGPNPSPAGDPTLDRALETFLGRTGKRPKDVLGSVTKGLGDELYDRLAATGTVEVHRGRFLRPNRFPVRRPDVREQVWQEVADVLAGRAPADLRTGTVIGLARAASALPRIFPPAQFGTNRRGLDARADKLADQDWSTGAVRAALRDAQEATMVAVIVASAATTTAAN
jgi:hypothetical protein